MITGIPKMELEGYVSEGKALGLLTDHDFRVDAEWRRALHCCHAPHRANLTLTPF